MHTSLFRRTIRHWVAILSVAPAIALVSCSSPSPEEQIQETRAALTAPLAISGFAIVGNAHVSILDRTVVSGGHVGVGPSTGDSINASFNVQLGVGKAVIGRRIVLASGTTTGDLFANQVVAPFPTTVNPASPPPSPPGIFLYTAGTTTVTVNSGQTRNLGPGKFGQITVNGRLNLTGGTYDVANLTLGADAVLNANAASLVRVTGHVTAADRVHIAPSASLSPRAMALVAGGSSDSVVLGADVRLTGIVVARNAFRAGDRLIGSGAIAAGDVFLAHDSSFAFAPAIQCNVDSDCNDNNACSTDLCDDSGQCHNTVDPICQNPPLLSSSQNHNFGVATVGVTLPTFVWHITNPGASPTGTPGVPTNSDTNQLTITANTCTTALGSNGSCDITVAFKPTAAGARSGTITLTATPGGTIALNASATGQAAVVAQLASDQSHDFGPVEIGVASSTFVWNITNTGGSNTGVPVAASSTTELSVVNSTCTSALAPGAGCAITVAFTPSAGGARSGTLALTATPGGTVTLTATASGAFRITVVKAGSGSPNGTVALPGASCGPGCSSTFIVTTAPFLDVLSSTTNGSNVFFSGWSVPACGATHDCFINPITSSQTITATFTSMTNNLVFVDFANWETTRGRAFYDARCNAVADSVGINNNASGPGNGYIALVSDSTSNAIDRLGPASGWVRLDARPFAVSKTDLFTNHAVLNPVRFTADGRDIGLSGGTIGALYLTGTKSDGTVDNAHTCNDWGTSAPGDILAGSSEGGPFEWTGRFFNPLNPDACHRQYSLLCIGNTKTAAVTPTVVNGKKIWLTNTFYDVGSVTPDAKCQGERPPGVVTAKALIATAGTSASSALSADMAQLYVRVDGTLVGTTAQLLAGGLSFAGKPDSGIWQSANGSYPLIGPFFPSTGGFGGAWTGQNNLTDSGTLGTTCGNWTNHSATALIGEYSFADGAWWSFGGNEVVCAEHALLYCVEQ